MPTAGASLFCGCILRTQAGKGHWEGNMLHAATGVLCPRAAEEQEGVRATKATLGKQTSGRAQGSRTVLDVHGYSDPGA